MKCPHCHKEVFKEGERTEHHCPGGAFLLGRVENGKLLLEEVGGLLSSKARDDLLDRHGDPALYLLLSS